MIYFPFIMMKDNLLQTVQKTVAKYRMFTQGETIVVGVSGGADSVALLHVLLQLKEQWKLNLIVAHVNHSLRGEESDRDQAFVENLCKQWQVPCHVERADILALSRAAGRGVEEFARGFRYAFFQQTVPHPIKGKIATAHTADDNAETVLLNLIRGTGVTGLSGIPPAGRVIRPLMECSRQMVEEYCKRHNLSFVTDSTNWQDEYRRNRIRHCVIPALKEENPAFLQAVTRMTQANRKDSDFLLKLGKDLLEQSCRENGYDIAVLRQAEDVPLTYAVKNWLRLSGLEESAYHLEKIKSLIQKGYGKCSLNGVWEAQVSGGILRKTHPEDKPLDFSYGIQKENGVHYVRKEAGPVIITVTHGKELHNSVTYNCLDCDTIGTQLVFRNRRAGDAITLPGRPRKSLKKLLNELKIPVWERSRLLILADENGVLWIEGIGCDIRAEVTPETTRILTIKSETVDGVIQ